jgi:HAD superfamily hydrolase (TIGR01549 family)
MSESAAARAYRAWLVDLDGTLYDARWLKLAMAAELGLLGAPAWSIVRRFRREHERLRAEVYSGELTPFEEQLRRTAAALGAPPERVRARVEEWLVRRPCKWIRAFRRRSLLTEIRDFREAGGRTALVSDYPAKQKLEALGASSLFDVVIANGEPGGPDRLKPAPDGLLLAAKALDVAPEDCLVLGDREDADGAAARAAGMEFRLVG